MPAMIKINFDFANLMSFLTGIFVGLALFVLYYLYQALKSLRKSKLNTKKTTQDIKEEEILKLIDEAKLKFKDKNLREERSDIGFMVDISKDLVYDVAKKFYPESKYPLYEITVDELLELFKYISNRVNELLDHRGLRMIKKITISKIIGFTDVKKKIDESAIMKTAKQLKIQKIFSTVKGIVNYANPVYWVKRLVVNNAINLVIRKICVVIIGITGEETYKIYSKKVFNQEPEIENDDMKLVDEIKEDLNNIDENSLEGDK